MGLMFGLMAAVFMAAVFFLAWCWAEGRARQHKEDRAFIRELLRQRDTEYDDLNRRYHDLDEENDDLLGQLDRSDHTIAALQGEIIIYKRLLAEHGVVVLTTVGTA